MRSFFFFQAEDGIRDLTVTGVQTCALPISYRTRGTGGVANVRRRDSASYPCRTPAKTGSSAVAVDGAPIQYTRKIGRASCRERVEISVGAGSLKKKKDEIWGDAL